MSVPRVQFNNGASCPILGIGMYLNSGEEGYHALKYAIDVGYRAIDSAWVYMNEKDVGRAINDKIKEGIVKREDLFITSKLWSTFHRPDMVETALRKTMSDLGTSYVDLYLIHWPVALKEGTDYLPKDAAGEVQFSDVDYVDTWKAMERCCEAGLAKSIGVSNFNRDQIERILKVARIKPVNNQIECHPFLAQREFIDYCKSKGMTVTAFRPMGGPVDPKAFLSHPTFVKLAEKYKKSPGQILLKFQIQRGVIVIPKSSNLSRIKENFNVFDFDLTDEDMNQLYALDKGEKGRTLYLEEYDFPKHKNFPFKMN